jgi:hypothetical protein
MRAHWLLLMLSGAGCATARPLAPLREGQLAIDGALPSVWFDSDPPLRIPSPTIGVRYGVTDSTELRFTLHPLHLFLEHRKILGAGGGGIFHLSPASGWIPALHFTADLTLFVPLEGGGGPGAIAIGDAAVLVHWEPVSWLFPYLVFDAAAATHQNTPITSLYAGLQIWPHGIAEFSLELGWFAFSVDRDRITSSLVGSGRGLLYAGGAVAIRLGKRWP